MTIGELIKDDRWSDYAAGLGEAGIDADDVAACEVIHSDTSSMEGYGQVDIEIIFKQGDSFVAVVAGCDTTGWDCRASGDSKVCATEEEARAWVKENGAHP